MKISIIVPAKDEEVNIPLLYDEIKEVMLDNLLDYEIIFIDDGSTDKTYEMMSVIKKEDSNVKTIKFRKNFGQTAAWQAGIDNAKGDLIITIDADLQNDPKDIPALIKELDKGYDVVSGWRFKRQDKFSRRVTSKMANWLRKRLTGDPTNDSGCSLKVYKKECFENVKLSSDMHRYITSLLCLRGFKVGEIKTNHRPRTQGKTKYGNFGRFFRAMTDLFNLYFWEKYSTRPLLFFGRLGFFSMLIGGLIDIYYFVYYFLIVGHGSASIGPLFILSVLFILSGIILISLGLFGEYQTKIYYSDKNQYEVKKV